jgi:uncharacterized protein with GYD domain
LRGALACRLTSRPETSQTEVIRAIKDATKRAASNEKALKRMGVEMKALCWTMGQFDQVSMVEAPDDVSMSAVSLAIGASVRDTRPQIDWTSPKESTR